MPENGNRLFGSDVAIVTPTAIPGAMNRSAKASDHLLLRDLKTARDKSEESPSLSIRDSLAFSIQGCTLSSISYPSHVAKNRVMEKVSCHACRNEPMAECQSPKAAVIKKTMYEHSATNRARHGAGKGMLDNSRPR